VSDRSYRTASLSLRDNSRTRPSVIWPSWASRAGSPAITCVTGRQSLGAP
jgi:hypothetical protein